MNWLIALDRVSSILDQLDSHTWLTANELIDVLVEDEPRLSCPHEHDRHRDYCNVVPQLTPIDWPEHDHGIIEAALPVAVPKGHGTSLPSPRVNRESRSPLNQHSSRSITQLTPDPSASCEDKLGEGRTLATDEGPIKVGHVRAAHHGISPVGQSMARERTLQTSARDLSR